MAIGIICIILEVLILSYIIFRIIKSKQISLKDTAAYPVLVLVSALLIFYGQVRYGTFDHWIKAVPSTLSGSLSLLVMKIDGELVSLFYANNFALLIGYVLAYVIAAVSLFSISISLLKVAVKNFLRIKWRNNELDYIFTLTSDAKTYVRNLTPEQRKNTVVVLQKNYDKPYTEEKLFLDDQKVKYLVAPFSSPKDFDGTMRRLMRFKRAEKYYFVSFMEKEAEIHGFVTNAKRYLEKSKRYDGSVQFVVSTTPSQTEYVRELIEGKPAEEVINLKGKKVPLLDESRGCVRFYDKYGIMAFDFIHSENLAKSFPKELINDDATVMPCSINLFVLGFGKVNQALIKDVLVNTQFVAKVPSKEKGKYELKPVRLDTYVFDENKTSADLQISSGILKYDKEALNAEEYFELPDDYRSHVTFVNEINAESVGCFDKIRDAVFAQKKKYPDLPIVNYYIVSLGSDFENVAIARKLVNNFSVEKSYSIVYVRTENSTVLDNVEAGKMIPFGDNKRVLSYDNVIADGTYAKAKMQSCIYSGAPATSQNIATEWSTLSKIKQDSNIYSVASLPFKCALLKADAEDVDAVAKLYDPENRRAEKKDAGDGTPVAEVYPFLFPAESFYPRDVIAFSEHERWLALEMSLGVTPMKKAKLGEYYANKTPDELNHACLTTMRGLEAYCNVVRELKASLAEKVRLDPTCDVQDNLGAADVIKYDFDLMDGFVNRK